MASYAAADRIGHALPQPTPELLQGFDTATQITALAHWLRHQSSPALPSAARAFALARPICLPPAPASTASCFGMPCASPSGAPLAAPALGSPPRLLPANGQFVGCRALGREGSAGLSVFGCRRPRFSFRQDSLVGARPPLLVGQYMCIIG